MRRALILTDYPLEPLHPRTEALAASLRRFGFAVDVRRRRPTWLDRLTLDAFALGEPLRLLLTRERHHVTLVQSSRLVGAVAVSRLRGERTVFETLDHWPSYFCAGQGRWWAERIPALSSLIATLERTIARSAADAILVNSDALARHFGGAARVIPYSSPLEDLAPPAGRGDRPLGLLYLGLFTLDKGALETLELAARLRVTLSVFGDVPEPEVAAALRARSDVTHRPRVDSQQLRDELRPLLSTHALVGVSLIKPVHRSYATQEANKDVDYLALGLPIVGNHRRPTAEKVQAGAGVFYDDPALLTRLRDDAAVYETLSARARELYAARYAACRFERALREVLEELTGGRLEA